MIEPYQQRVIAERNELDAKREKLTAFMKTQQFADLSERQRVSMAAQSGHMWGYSLMLHERLLDWGIAE